MLQAGFMLAVFSNISSILELWAHVFVVALTKKVRAPPMPNRTPCVTNIAGTDFVEKPAVNSPSPRKNAPHIAVVL